MNKKAYITPDFEVIDMQTENLIAASNITISDHVNAVEPYRPTLLRAR